MPHNIDIAQAALDPQVQALDLSAFGRQDLVNIILQRSEVLYDLPRAGQVIRAWGVGDPAPLETQVDRLGTEIARRAAAVIHAEYQALRPLLQDLGPRRIADIGCGYAFFDLFAARDLGADLLLIDLEQNEHRHFGFASEGAAYSSLSVARQLLEANGIAPAAIETLNPATTDVLTSRPADLAVSFLSCGFHYPVDLYLTYFDLGVGADGALILDLREKTADKQAAALAPLGPVINLPAPPKARRVLLRKGRGAAA